MTRMMVCATAQEGPHAEFWFWGERLEHPYRFIGFLSAINGY